MIENSNSESEILLKEVNKKNKHSMRIGITGPPGAGKSTITNQLIQNLREENKSVCALLVDPTSPFTKGAILGDRIRITNKHNDKNLFIRSIASRGFKGGLADNIDSIAEILEYAGFDIIIFETVGVGQIELDVVELVDTVGVVLVPESGDDIQIMKAGLIEIADIYIICQATFTTPTSQTSYKHIWIIIILSHSNSISKYSTICKRTRRIN